MLKLNLGSGDHVLEGFTNVDLYDETAEVRADICDLPYANDSVDEAVAFQVIEHLPYNKNEQLFKEWYRVLKPGGQIIIETPDIDAVCRKVLEEGLLDKWVWNMVGQYYRPWDQERYSDWEHNAASIHRNPWNFTKLKSMAEAAGFTVEQCPFDEYVSRFEENMRVRLTK